MEYSNKLKLYGVLALIFGLTQACVAQTGAPPSASARAHVVEQSGVRGGLVVILAGKDADRIAEWAPSGPYLTQILLQDEKLIAETRKTLRERRVYGEVSVRRFDGRTLPYVDNLANVVVVTKSFPIPREELMRVLAPRGALLVCKGVEDTLPDAASPLADGDWFVHHKPVPAETDEWTHFRYDATGNMMSKDTRIAPPRYTQWISGPRFQRHHGMIPSITASVTSGGRIFCMIDEAPNGFVGLPEQWHVVARDAHNGVLLWRRKMESWGTDAWSYVKAHHASRFNHPIHVRKRLIAKDDRVYTTLGFNSNVVAMDAASGKTVLMYDGTRFADEMVLQEGVLYVAVNDRRQEPYPGTGVRPENPARLPAPSKKTMHAIDAASGKHLWKAGPFRGNPSKLDRLASMRHLNLTVGGSTAVVIDEKEIIGIDCKTGKETWRTKRLMEEGPFPSQDPGDLYHLLANKNRHTVVYDNGRLFVLHPTDSPAMKHTDEAIVQALDMATGKELWQYRDAVPIAYIDWPDLFVIEDTVWVPEKKGMNLIGLDAATGKEKIRHSIRKALDVGHHHRCYPNRASVNFAILGRRGAEFVDFKSGEITVNHWLRGGCRTGHVIGNGLFYRPPDHCQCYMAFQPRGFMALSAKGQKPAKPAAGQERLITGSAYGKVAAPATNAAKPETEHWPMFRHDAMRSSMATCSIPTQPSKAWELSLGKTLSAPVVAEGKAFVSSLNDHRVYAIDLGNGSLAWSFTAGATVDSPPSVWNGHVVFGCNDGWVYCLQATDGALAWRYRAAPSDRSIVAFGRVESAWPVKGSVLVSGGVAWFVAGRTSMLDGGIIATALDIRTGKTLSEQTVSEVQSDTRTTGSLPTGALSDILTTDGSSLYLHRRRLELSPAPTNVWPSELCGTEPLLTADAGFADDQWFHRAFWHYESKNGKAKGNLIAFDETRVYAVAANHPGSPNMTFHVPAGGNADVIGGVDGRGPRWLANPNVHVGGTILFAAGTAGDSGAVEKEGRKVRKRPTSPWGVWSREPALWRHEHFPIIPSAMLVGKGRLVVAGALDASDQEDPWKHFEGRGGGFLYVIDAKSGKELSRVSIASPPVWNGIAAAGGNIYLSTVEGKVVCFSRP